MVTAYRGNTPAVVFTPPLLLFTFSIVNSPPSGEGPELECDGEMDGMGCGPEWGVCGDDGSNGDDKRLASSVQATDPVQFERRMAQLRVITAVYMFPVDEPMLKAGTYGRTTIHVNACCCTGCGQKYDRLSDGEATLVSQVCRWVLMLGSGAASVYYHCSSR